MRSRPPDADSMDFARFTTPVPKAGKLGGHVVTIFQSKISPALPVAQFWVSALQADSASAPAKTSRRFIGSLLIMGKTAQ
jgi:hypothetical protein